MALYLLRAIWEIPGELARDRFVWGFNVTAIADPSASDWRDIFEASLSLPAGAPPINLLQPQYVPFEYQVYNVDVGGPPIDVAGPDVDPPVSGGVEGPQEVQVVISRWVNDGLGRPFKKGRMFFGPISGSAMSTHRRVPVGTMDRLGAWAVDLHARMLTQVWQPVVDTKGALHVPEEIVQYSVDNAWDTQRRRGVDPDASTVYVPA